MCSSDLNASLFAYYREALRLRDRFSTLIDGDVQVIGADNASRTFALARTGSETLVAVFNRSEATQTFKFSMGATDGGTPPALVPIFTSQGPLTEIVIQQEGAKMEVTLPGLTGVLLKRN